MSSYTHTHIYIYIYKTAHPLLRWETGSTGRGLESKEGDEEEEERGLSVYTEARPPPQLLPSAVLPNNKPVIGTVSG